MSETLKTIVPGLYTWLFVIDKLGPGGLTPVTLLNATKVSIPCKMTNFLLAILV